MERLPIQAGNWDQLLHFLGLVHNADGSLPTGGAATFVVAASDASARSRATADFVCDGVADNVEIQAAHDACPSNGGVVGLTPGTFNLAATVIRSKPVLFQASGGSANGVGAFTPATHVNWSGAAGGIMFSRSGSGVSGGGYKGFNLDANSNAVCGISEDRMVGAIIEDVHGEGWPTKGKYPAKTNGTSPAVSNPAVTPTVAVTGGGSAGGLLAAGAYRVVYTFVNAGGETVASTTSAQFTVSAGNIPRVTLPALAANATSINLYVTEASGIDGTQGLYATGITTTTYDMSAAYYPVRMLHLYTTGSAGDNTSSNLIQNISTNAVPTIIRLDGNPGHNANCCHNTFTRTQGNFTAAGIVINDGDNNSFHSSFPWRQQGTGWAVFFGGWARANYFFHLEPNGGVYSSDNATGGANSGNAIYGYDQENNEDVPVYQSSNALTLTWFATGQHSGGLNTNEWVAISTGRSANGPQGPLDVYDAGGDYLFGSTASSGQNPSLKVFGFKTAVGITNGALTVSTGGVFQLVAPTAGVQVGTAIGDKVGFYDKAPIAKPSAVGAAAGFAAGTTAVTFHSDDTYTGNTGATAYTINGIVAALKNLGLLTP